MARCQAVTTGKPGTALQDVDLPHTAILPGRVSAERLDPNEVVDDREVGGVGRQRRTPWTLAAAGLS
jgi:hypothetical protein